VLAGPISALVDEVRSSCVHKWSINVCDYDSSTGVLLRGSGDRFPAWRVEVRRDGDGEARYEPHETDDQEWKSECWMLVSVRTIKTDRHLVAER
jgi:hypothetical protein